jgi:histidinol dehydrogenase
VLDIRECREVPAELKRGGRSFWREQKELTARVTAVIDRVAQEGDAALTALSRELDGVELTAAELRVAPAELAEAAAALPAALKEALLVARENIRRFSAAPPPGSLTVNAAGAVLGTRSLPLKRVGVYIPGGRAAYPSSVLMNVVPAQAAGVAEIALATPPAGGHGHPLVLGTAYLLGVREVYCVGGAQAIAALALGTETIPAVDKVVGPGNAYVAAAKRLLFGCVGIDAVAGPSEVLILADAGAAPAVVARDLIAQAEHDAAAQALLVTTSQRLAEEVARELEKELATLPRAELARAALASSAAYVVPDLELAVALANAWAPEHLELLLADPWAVLPRVQNAGTVFLGPYTPEALGDYIAGPSHVLPTGGTARFASPLGVEDFCKRLNFLAYGREAWQKDAPAAELLARAEGLAGHARALVGRE